MEVVEDLIAADGVHIGIEAGAHMEVVALQGVALPLGQGVHHLAVGADVGHVEGDGTLIAVEVVVEAGGLLHKQRGGNPPQIQGITEIFLKILLDKFDCALGLVDRQGRMISRGNHDFGHARSSFFMMMFFAVQKDAT